MGKVILLTAPTSTGTASTTHYVPIATTPLAYNATEVRAQIPFRAAGTLSGLMAVFRNNSATTSCTIRVRKNAANGNLNLTIPASTSGVFEDTSNTDTIAAGDKMAYQFVEPDAGLTCDCVSTIFDATTNTVHITSIGGVGSGTGVDLSGGSITRWWPICGRGVTDGTTSEANISSEVGKAGTLRNLFFYVSANARTNNTVVQDYKNTANGALTIVVGSGATGLFEDTTNSTTYAATDRPSFTTQTLSGTATLTFHSLGAHYVTTTTDSGPMVTAITNGSTLTSSATRWLMIGGAFAVVTTESIAHVKTRGTCILNYLQARVTSNSTTLTIRTRKNSADGNCLISVSSGATGLFTDTTNSDTCATTDNICIQTTTGAANPVMTLVAININNLQIATTTTVSQTSIHKYNLRKYLSQTIIHKYNISQLATVAQTSIQKYNLKQLIPQTSTQKYNIRRVVAITTSIQKYNLRRLVAVTTSIQKYNLRLNVLRTIIHKYGLGGVVAQTTTHKYNILSLFAPIPMNPVATREFISNFFTKF